MKKLATLILAAGLVFGSVCGAVTDANAIDFKGKGDWYWGFDFGQGGDFMKKGRGGYDDNNQWQRGNRISGYNGGEDEFEARQRVRLQLDVIASESLSGTVYFEIGGQRWGRSGDGAQLGTDGIQVKVRYAYLDWIIPNTELKVRMGLQNIKLPAFAMGASQIFDEDVAGIALSNQFTENFGMTFFWARPYNDNFPGANGDNWVQPANFLDNFDLFGLVLPMTFDGFKISPFAMVGAWGPNTFYNGYTREAFRANYAGAWRGIAQVDKVLEGLYPAVVAGKPEKSLRQKEYAVPFWLGVTGEITAADPFRFAFDVNYGNNGQVQEELKRSGWLATVLAEYKMDWGTPGIYFWYGSGDDDNAKNGSERMPTFGTSQSTNGYSYFASNGNPQLMRETVMGTTPFIGTWGIGARLKDMSFLDGLKTTFSVNWFNGTNAPKMAKYMRNNSLDGWRVNSGILTDFNSGEGLYLTSQDHALEFTLFNRYNIYDNLTLFVEGSYVALWLDQSKSVWGNCDGVWDGGRSGAGGVQTTDAWNINVSFLYSF